ncbi:ABC transporter permease [Stutzerimonas chloritidismutans AW-1]|uniref:ABC transporter permease n=1 Tax=Stutzerimonas chloritidismutans AW-1 TaxID=1263865 RepID=V4QKP5_STUCH|nr:ABC transporter permease [Stutzerimonas chloritidismutans]ESR00464.1 ABC transporter permease [Stutzerimonas chloritidismutans AW-1]
MTPIKPRALRLKAQADRFAPWLALLVLLLIWEAACRLLKLPSFVLPSPSAIFAATQKVGLGAWAEHIFATLRVTLMGYGLSILIGIPLAIALASSRVMSRTLYPLLVIVQSTPIVAVAPIIVVVMGAGDLPRVFITFLIAFFPIVVSCVTGLLATPEELVELSRSLGASKAREYRNIRLPYAIPHLFSALRISITLAVIGAVVAEFVAAEKGLGYFINFSTSMFQVPQAFAALMMLVVISLVLFHLIGLLQKAFFPWSLPKGGH